MPEAKGYIGNPVFTVEDVERLLRKNGPTKTGELAEAMDVTGPAIRKKLEDVDRVKSKKIRGVYIWYAPHEAQRDGELPEPDGGLALPAGLYAQHLSPLAGTAGYLFSVLSVVMALASIVTQLTLAPAVITLGVAALFLHLAWTFSDQADPSFEIQDAARALETEDEE